MVLDEKLYNLFEEKARETMIEVISLGLGYTAVKTSDGGIGIAYTYFDRKASCCVGGSYVNYEKRPALELLRKIKDADPIRLIACERSFNHA
jgi:hypothetical protein